MLAYHLTEAHAAANRWTKTKPGRYLTAHTTLTPKEVKFWAEWHIKGQRPDDAVDDEQEIVLFASTPDEIEYVYLNGPASCMSHQAKSYESNEHPVRMYGAGDLAIAHLPYRPDDSDHLDRTEAQRPEFKARAICWPERKIYGRVYPEDCYPEGAALVHGLQALGYSHARLHPIGFSGARMLRVEDGDDLIVPYLDSPCQNFDDDGDNLILCQKGDWSGDSTSGLVSCAPEYEHHCEWCEEGFNGEYETVYTRVEGNGGRDGMTVCPSCAVGGAFYCEGFDETFSDDVEHDTWDGDTYTQYWLDDNTFISDFSDDRFPDDVLVMMHDGASWAHEELEGNAVRRDGEWWPTDKAETELDRRAANVDDRNGVLALSMGEW